MPLVNFSVQIDSSLAGTADDFCRVRGIMKSPLVTQLLLDHLEDWEDGEEVERMMADPTRPLGDMLRELNLDVES